MRNRQLGDVVFVELPKVGRDLKESRSRRVVDPSKPLPTSTRLSREVTEVNEALAAEPALCEFRRRGQGLVLQDQDRRQQ